MNGSVLKNKGTPSSASSACNRMHSRTFCVGHKMNSVWMTEQGSLALTQPRAN